MLGCEQEVSAGLGRQSPRAGIPCITLLRIPEEKMLANFKMLE